MQKFCQQPKTLLYIEVLAIRVQSAAVSSSKQYAVLSRHSDTEYQHNTYGCMLNIVQNAYGLGEVNATAYSRDA